MGGVRKPKGASRQLGMPLSTVSRRVADLERHLTVRLLERTNRRFSLTPEGETYLVACRRILDDVNEAESVACGEYATPKGQLVLTAPIVFGRLHVVPIVVAFLAAYPHIDIQLMLADRVLALQDAHVDVAVRIGHLPDSAMMAVAVGSVRSLLVASPEYLRRCGTPQVPSDVEEYACIGFKNVSAPERWMFVERNDAGDVISVPTTIRPRLVVNTAEAALDAAALGLGLTRALSYQAALQLERGELVRLLRPFEPEPLPVSLVYPSQAILPLKVRAFLDFAKPRLRAR